MSEFLLIHGSCHGAWCWVHLIRELAALGHEARAIDLPGSGDDPTPLAKVTADSYRNAILSALDGFDTPPILLGHSAAGYPVSDAAMAAPDRLAHLVYLCAYLPETGLSMIDRRRQARRQPLAGALTRTADGLAYGIDPARAACFYGACPPDRAAWAQARLTAQPILPQETPLTVTRTLRDLPKTYIRCLEDGAIPTEFQSEMASQWAEMRHLTLDSDHSPFLSQPDRLAALLDSLAK